MTPRSIAAVNQLPQPVKEALYTRLIPDELMTQFAIPRDFRDAQGRRLLDLRCASGATDIVLALRRRVDDPDPLLYTHLTDTVMGQVHVLLYVIGAALILVAVFSKIIGAYLGSRLLTKTDHWTALSFGAGLNARGAIQIIVATIGLSFGILSQEIYSLIIITAVVTSLMAPVMLRWTLKSC